MISLCGGKSFRSALITLTRNGNLILFPALILISAFALIAVTPRCLAESGSSDSSPNLDRHARKIHHELARFSPGSYIRLTFTDGSERTVALDSVQDTSFTGTNAESNNRETHTYAEIAHVTREKYYIGEGNESHVRHIKLWVPIAVGVLAAGAAITAAEIH
jgi:hypothetical protein